MNACLQEKRQAVTFSEKHDGLTPLALAVREQCSAETVAVLLAAGASPVSLMDASPDIPESINVRDDVGERCKNQIPELKKHGYMTDWKY